MPATSQLILKPRSAAIRALDNEDKYLDGLYVKDLVLAAKAPPLPNQIKLSSLRHLQGIIATGPLFKTIFDTYDLNRY